MKISIIGATGYGGAELVRILHQHPETTIHSIHSSSQSGQQLYTSYPHFQDAVNMELEAIDPVKIANETDVVFAATPSGVSSKLIPQLMQAGAKVIDLSGDFRLKDSEAYESWYKKQPGDEHWVQEAVYGLTEWFADDIKDANLIANPGCYPTAALLGLAPLVKNNLIDLNSIIIDAKSGVSGAGRGTSPIAHFPEMNDNLKVYKVNEHQHIPEIEQTLGRFNSQTGPVSFTTHLVPMTRGIMTTIYANASEDLNINKLREIYGDTYNSNYFVRLRVPGNFPGTREVCGSNFCDIGLAYCERTNRITVVSVIDNVMKGASGQAVQNMNKRFGLDEKTGLDFLPIYP